MNIGILSKRTTMFTGKLKTCLVNKGFNVSIYTLDNLVINRNLLNQDLYILKSKNLFFLYAGYFLEANGIPVIPKPDISFIQKHRIHSNLVMKRIGLTTPEIYLGTIDTFKKKFKLHDFPFILKPIMGSGSKGVKIIRSFKDLDSTDKTILYLEKFINGIHYNVYFIDDKICTLIKPPLSNEHVDMKLVKTPEDVRNLILKWRNYFNGDLLFGHLDIIREESTDILCIVDPGSFPEFTNWKCNSSPVEIICNIILEKYRYLKKK